MRSFSVLSALVLAVDNTPQHMVAEPPFIWEVIQEEKQRDIPLVKTFHGVHRDQHYWSLHSKENCKFPLDVVILQDTTDSFSDNIESMKNKQLDLVYNGISTQHPDSRFAVVSFKDKPIEPMGNRDDYCTKYDAPLSDNGITDVKEAYSKMVSYGGYDAPENQFGTLYNVLSSNKVQWSNDTAAVKLVVISTDAGPHFAGDAHEGKLPAFDPLHANDDDGAVCTARYYPSPEQIRSKIAATGAYVASLVYDGDWANGWPSKSWITFNKFIGQEDAFVAPQAPDSSDFWARLAKIITTIEEDECKETTTTTTTTTTEAPTTITTTEAPTTTTTTTAAPTTTTTTEAPTTTTTTTAAPTTTTAVPTTVAPTTTTEPTTTTTPIITTTTTTASTVATSTTAADTTSQTVSTQGPTVTSPSTTTPVTTTARTTSSSSTTTPNECHCPCVDCGCCPEVIIKLQHRPMSLHLDVENAATN